MDHNKKRGNRRDKLVIFSLFAAAFVDGSEDHALSILWPHMHGSLDLSVGRLGLVLGVSQLVIVFTLPIWGVAADRFSRRKLLIWITGFWGAWTFMLSQVQTLPQLIIVRIFSAIGFGVFAPAAFSLIGDLFPNHNRGRIVGIIMTGNIIGRIISFGVLPAIAKTGPESWRWGFALTGAASVLTGLLMILIKEPLRGESEQELTDIVGESSYRETFKWLDLRHLLTIRSWRFLALNSVLVGSGIGIFFGWSFTWLNEIELGQSVFLIVLLIAIGSIGGSVFFGWYGDHLEVKQPGTGRIRLIFAGLVLVLPLLVLFILIGNRSIPLLIICGFIFGLGTAVTGSCVLWPTTQAILPPEIRASGRAFINMVTGASAALVLTLSGWIADQFGVSMMLLIVIPLPALVSIIAWLPLFRTYPIDLESFHDSMNDRRESLLKKS